MLRLLPLPAILALTLALTFNKPSAVAHEWYPQHCCSDKDCHPINCAEITTSPDYYHWHSLLFPKNASYPSQDGGCHVCVSAGGSPLCLFFGGVS
jgi:hypothetical protein